MFLASLVNAYDSSWQVESVPSLIGNFSCNEETSALSKKDLTNLRRWMILMGISYLVPKGSNLAEKKKFSHLVNTIMDKIEQRHGTKLKPMVSSWLVFEKISLRTLKKVVQPKKDKIYSSYFEFLWYLGKKRKFRYVLWRLM